MILLQTLVQYLLVVIVCILVHISPGKRDYRVSPTSSRGTDNLVDHLSELSLSLTLLDKYLVLDV